MAKSIKLKNNYYWSKDSIKQDIIKVIATNDQLYSQVGDVEINFDKTDFNIGNGFELRNGKVIVKSNNIHHVRVSLTMWVERYNNSFAWCYLQKSGNMQCSYMVGKSNLEPWQSIHITTIFAVKQNDSIYPQIYFSEANRDNGVRGGTYSNSVQMVVEAID